MQLSRSSEIREDIEVGPIVAEIPNAALDRTQHKICLQRPRAEAIEMCTTQRQGPRTTPFSNRGHAVFDRIHPTVVAPFTDELYGKSIKRRYRHRAIIISSPAERIASVQAECLRDRPTQEMLLAQARHLTIGIAEEAAHLLTVAHECDGPFLGNVFVELR